VSDIHFSQKSATNMGQREAAATFT